MPNATGDSTTALFQRVAQTLVFISRNLSIAQSGFADDEAAPSYFYAGEKAYASEIRWRTGAKPGHAIVIIPMTPGVHMESGNSIAFNPGGPIKDIFQGGRLAIQTRTGPTASAQVKSAFVGTIYDIEHRRMDGQDCLVVLAYDDRYRLNEVRIHGRWVVNAVAGVLPASAVQYQEGWPSHFNRDGKPSLIFYGNLPALATSSDMGLADTDQVPDPASRPQDKATYFTLETLLYHILWFYTRPLYEDGKFPFMKSLPRDIEVDLNMGAGLDSEAITNFNQAVGQSNSAIGNARKGRDICLEGLPVLEAIEHILQMAGGYTLLVDPMFTSDALGAPTYKSVLRAVPSRYQSDGISIPFAFGGKAQDVLGRAVVTRASFRENSENFFTSVVGSGDRHFVERQLSTVDGALQRAWTQTRLDAMLAKAQLGGVSDITQFNIALQNYAEPLSFFKINPAYDIYEGTPWAGYPRTDWCRPPWPRLLSFPNGQDTIGDILAMAWPLRVEVSTDGGSNWTAAGVDLDGMEVWDNGIISLGALRNIPATENSPQPKGTWKWTSTPFAVSAGKLSVTNTDVRITLAIPTDHRLTRWASLANDNMTGDGFIGTQNTFPDSARVASDFRKTKFMDLGRLYQSWFARNSYPLPQSLGGAAKNGFIRNDQALLDAHVKKDLYNCARLAKNGSLYMDGHLVTSYRPGMPVKNMIPVGTDGAAPFDLNAVLSEVIWRNNPGTEPGSTGTEFRLT